MRMNLQKNKYFWNLALLLMIAIFAASPLFSSIKKLESNTNRLILELKPEFKGFKEIKLNDGSIAYMPDLSNTMRASDQAGSPGELVETALITVPSQNGFEIESINIGEVEQFKKLISPVPTLVPSNDIAYNDFVIDQQIYKNHKTPAWANLSYEGISRSRHLARLTIYSARYDAQKSIIEIPKSIIITINFKNQPTTKNLSPADNLLSFSINSKETNSFAIQTAPEEIQSSKLTNLNEISSGNWVKLTIQEEGVYKIDASQLAARGLTIPADLVNTIKVFGHGGQNLKEPVAAAFDNDMNEQAIIVNKKPSGELESIIFYANGVKGFTQAGSQIESYRNDFSFDNYYFVTFGGRDGLRPLHILNSDKTADFVPSWYYHRIFLNEESTNPYPDGAGRTYMGRSYFTSPFMDLLYNLKRDENIIYRIGVAHRSTTTGSNGTFVIKQAGNPVATIPLSSTNSSYQHLTRSIGFYTAPSSQVAVDGRSVLSFSYTNSSIGATPYFDFYEIHYPREFIPIDNELSFFSDMKSNGIVEYRTNGFTGGSIYAYQIIDGKAYQLSNMAVTGGMFIFNKDELSSKASKYFLSSNLRSPASMESVTMANLRGKNDNADIIVITHSEFEKSANEFAQFRSTQSGLSTTVVKVEDIYNEFSSGIPDITALRDYLSFCYHNWQHKPSYVVIWGDAHYDYRNIQIKSTLYVPTYLNNDSDNAIYETSTIATDDYITWVEGNDKLMDLAIGRVPVDNKAVADAYLEKLKHYTFNSSKDNWRTSIIMVADDSFTEPSKGGDGPLHIGDSEEISNILPNEVLQKKIYLPDYPTENIANGKRKPGVSQEFIGTVNTSGGLIFNWVGHGNPRVLSHEQFFERETTIPQLSNLDKLFFVTAATCDFGRFDKADPRSGAEELVFSKLGGAIAVLTATRVVGAADNSLLNNQFYECLFTRDDNGKFPTIGEALMQAKQVRSSENSQRFVILGDPTLNLHYPQSTVKIETINGDSLNNDEVISLEALSTVDIVAKVYDAKGQQLDANFNGTAYITLLDGDEYKTVIDDINQTYNFRVQGASLNRSTCQVENGIIKARFVIPKDISFSENNARLFIYAASDDNEFATGSTTMIKVDGINATSVNDSRGPNVQIFMDSYSFKSGDVVRRSPLLLVDLNDETGINSTGLGIGHRIEAWIDDNPNPIDLTAKFNTSLVDPKAGTIQQFLYDLSVGRHTIKVRAWDVFNNPTSASTEFIIPAVGEERISDVLLLPNPMPSEGRIKIFHNFVPPFTIDMKIFNSAGIEVRRLEEVSSSQLETLINWDGRTDSGNYAPQGAYYYYVRLISKTSGIVEKGGRLGIIVR